MLAVLELLLGRWFVRRSFHEAQIREVLEQNHTLLRLVDDAQDASEAVLKELRKRPKTDYQKESPDQPTLH
jgi:hypothetical protein